MALIHFHNDENNPVHLTTVRPRAFSTSIFVWPLHRHKYLFIVLCRIYVAVVPSVSRHIG